MTKKEKERLIELIKDLNFTHCTMRDPDCSYCKYSTECHVVFELTALINGNYRNESIVNDKRGS
jgi:hypothetical protein